MNSNLRWIGGKQKFVEWINSYRPPTDSYHLVVDVFGGGASFILNQQGKARIYNDLGNEVFNYWQVVKDQPKALVEMLVNTPYSRELLDKMSRAEWVDNPSSHFSMDVARAWRFFSINRQTMAGMGTSPGKSAWSISSRIRSEKAESVSSWMSAIQQIDTLSMELREVALENDDFEKIISRFDAPATLFYVDPPYDLGTETNTYYEVPFTEQDQRRLALALHACKGKVMLSGYDTEQYKLLYGKWTKHILEVKLDSQVGEKKHTRTECLWVNYSQPSEVSMWDRLKSIRHEETGDKSG